MKARLTWNAKSLREALATLPDDLEVSLEGCGCCASDHKAGISVLTLDEEDGTQFAVLRRYRKIEEVPDED